MQPVDFNTNAEYSRSYEDNKNSVCSICQYAFMCYQRHFN